MSTSPTEESPVVGRIFRIDKHESSDEVVRTDRHLHCLGGPLRRYVMVRTAIQPPYMADPRPRYTHGSLRGANIAFSCTSCWIRCRRTGELSRVPSAAELQGAPRTKAIAISDFILILPSFFLALARAGPVRRRALPLDEVQHGSASAQHGTQTRPRQKAPGSTRYWPAWHLRGACD